MWLSTDRQPTQRAQDMSSEALIRMLGMNLAHRFTPTMSQHAPAHGIAFDPVLEGSPSTAKCTLHAVQIVAHRPNLGHALREAAWIPSPKVQQLACML